MQPILRLRQLSCSEYFPYYKITLTNFIGNHIILGPVVSSLVGLIPNCAASVIITNLYIQGVINASSLIAGLLTGAGVGLIVLFRMNKNIKQN